MVWRRCLILFVYVYGFFVLANDFFWSLVFWPKNNKMVSVIGWESNNLFNDDVSFFRTSSEDVNARKLKIAYGVTTVPSPSPRRRETHAYPNNKRDISCAYIYIYMYICIYDDDYLRKRRL